MKRSGAVALTGLGIVGVLLVAGRLALPGLLERFLQDQITEDEDWSGEVGRIELDLWRAEAVVHGLRVEALSGRQVLKSVDLPVARVSWRWGALWRGVFDAHMVAERPTVVIGTKVGPKEPDLDGNPLPEPGWFRFTLDAVPIDGTFVFVDGTTEPTAEVVLTPVTGTIEGLGTIPGPARFDLVALAPGGGTVHFDALMDFWNAHLDAFDMRFDIDDLNAAALPVAARAYLGTPLAEGQLDATFGLTLDKGRRELPPDAPFYGGPPADLRRGSFQLDLVARDVVPVDPPVEQLSAERVALQAHGVPVGDDPVVLRADLDGVDAVVSRAWIEGLRAGGPSDPGQLPPVRLEGLDVDGRLTFVDRGVQPNVEVTAHDLALRTSERPVGHDIHLVATVRGARLEATGTVAELAWQSDLDLRARLDGLDAPAIAPELAAYFGVDAERGTADAVAEVRGRDGEVTTDVVLDLRDVRARESGWTIAADRAVLDLFDGVGTARGVSIVPAEGGALQHIAADRARLGWSPERLREGVVVASVEAHRPVVIVLERPGPGDDDDDEPGGKVPWSVDVLATDGTVVWRDPVTEPEVEIAIEEVDGTIRRLGTIHPTSLWDLAGELPGGGSVAMVAEMDPVGRDREQPWRLDVEVRGASLPALQDEVAGYIGRQVFATGSADADLSIVWMTAAPDRPTASGHLRLRARDLTVADPPVDAIALRRLSMEARWDPSTDGPYHVTGSASGVDVLAGPLASDGGARSLAAWLGELPPFRVERFDVHGGEVRYVDGGARVPIDLVGRDVELRLYALDNLGERRATLVADAALAGGALEARVSVAPLSTSTDFHLTGALRGVPAVELNEALREWARLDVTRGTIDVLADVDGVDGVLDGELRTVLRGVDVLQLSDAKRPIDLLRSIGVGILFDLVDHDDVATVTFPVEGTVARPDIEVIPGFLRALKRSLGVGVAADTDAVALEEP